MSRRGLGLVRLSKEEPARGDSQCLGQNLDALGTGLDGPPLVARDLLVMASRDLGELALSQSLGIASVAKSRADVWFFIGHAVTMHIMPIESIPNA